ncbi:MAG: hypothetical protein L0229_29570 [Blastocatellia bacterium]|nr:hypothetical protein [Blastocatellia bacterium]
MNRKCFFFVWAFLSLAAISFAQSISNPTLREELLKREQVDQDIRIEALKAAPNGGAIPQGLADRWLKIDKENTERMKQIVKEYGWPGKSMVGEDGAQAAWLLVQHADRDREFQKQCLKLLEKAVEVKEASGTDLAYLTDRVRVAEGKPQVYGTQMTIIDGKYDPAPIEDEANVDKRRAAVGLEPLADYVKRMKRNND